VHLADPAREVPIERESAFVLPSRVLLPLGTAGKIQPESPARAISAVATLGYLGFLLGPVMIGGLAGLVGLRLALIGTAVLTSLVYFLAPAMHASPVPAGAVP
jgi:MFS family permease